jgi:hypothetical protein
VELCKKQPIGAKLFFKKIARVENEGGLTFFPYPIHADEPGVAVRVRDKFGLDVDICWKEGLLMAPNKWRDWVKFHIAPEFGDGRYRVFDMGKFHGHSGCFKVLFDGEI